MCQRAPSRELREGIGGSRVRAEPRGQRTNQVLLRLVELLGRNDEALDCFNEMLVIGLLFLVLFGPSKLPQMARDLGRFLTEARRSVDEFKTELVSDKDEDEGRHPKRNR